MPNNPNAEGVILSKVCTKCNVEKPVTDFYKNKQNPTGYLSSCKKCAEEYKRNNPRSKQYFSEYREKNRDRIREYHKDHYEENKESIREKQNQTYSPEKTRARKLLSVYNITQDDYNAMLERQNHVCAICKGVNANGYSLYVDHDHSCCPGEKSCGKCVRGLLCMTCNFGIGNFKDSPALIDSAREYLKHYKE